MTISIPTKSTPTHKPTTSNTPILLGAAALLIVGIWLGATFLSSTPKPVERPEEVSTQVPVLIQPQTPIAPPPVVEVPRPVEPGATQPTETPRPADPDALVNPFQHKKANKGSLSENPDATLKPVFGSSGSPKTNNQPPKTPPTPTPTPTTTSDPDSALNPFKKKPTVITEPQLTDPFKPKEGALVAPDKTLQPTFKTP